MERVAVIGIGQVGELVVEGLAEAYSVVGSDVDPAKESVLESYGADWEADPLQAAAGADAVLMAVPGAPESTGLLGADGGEGIPDVLKSGALVVDTSTVGPDAAGDCAAACEEEGIDYLTAPLTLNAPAHGGGMHVMAGGSEAAYERAAPLLDAFCVAHERIGTPVDAQTFKLGLQLRYAGQAAVDAEVVSFARDNDIDPEPYRDFLGLDVPEGHLTREFEPEIPGMSALDIWEKDVGYLLDKARAEGTATPLANAVFEAYKHGVRTAEEGENGRAAILRYWEALNS